MVIDDNKIESVSVLSVFPNDVIIIKVPKKLCPESLRSIGETMKFLYPRNKSVILEEGLSIEIMRENKEAF